jgi:hypothetical protein
MYKKYNCIKKPCEQINVRRVDKDKMFFIVSKSLLFRISEFR